VYQGSPGSWLVNAAERLGYKLLLHKISSQHCSRWMNHLNWH